MDEKSEIEPVCAACGEILTFPKGTLKIMRPGWETSVCSIGCVVSVLMARIEKLENDLKLQGTRYDKLLDSLDRQIARLS